ncbi:unnamed protein product [Prorocentrum cordatum]|uniref:Uncharacterized protein n=1 Tax=Prorocentrum cordatum TaxID=2364126 RepID=A0ABN9VRW4_9DINO|nr:unnamed protein product [Polarella glacialis]
MAVVPPGALAEAAGAPRCDAATARSTDAAEAAVPFDAESVAFYDDNFTKTEVCDMLVQRDCAIQALEAELRLEKRRRLAVESDVGVERIARHRAELQLAGIRKEVQFRTGAFSRVGVHAGYTLARKRHSAQCSQIGTLQMVAAGELHGNVADPKTIARFEPMVSVAKRVRNHMIYFAAKEGRTNDICEVHLISSDATSHELVDNSKARRCNQVHMSIVSSIVAARASFNLDGNIDAWSTKMAGDLQKVLRGSADEHHGLLLRDLESTRCPTWRQRVAESADAPTRMNTCFGADVGGENIASIKRVVAEVKGHRNVAVGLFTCIFHGVHLICKDVLRYLESDLDEALQHSQKYVSALATVSNVWRSTGIASAIRQCADNSDEIPSVIKAAFKRKPGRVLRGRWGSVDDIESLLKWAMPHIQPVFEEVFERKIKAAEKALARKKKTDPGEDEGVAFQTDQKNYRILAAQAASSSKFKAIVVISSNAKRVLHRLLTWGQKAVKEQNQRTTDASAKGETYLGPTAMSRLVCTEAQSMWNSLNEQLLPSTEHDVKEWGLVFELLPEELHLKARDLIMSLLLLVATAFSVRILRRTRSVPLKLLNLLEGDPREPRDVRKDIASELLDLDDCCVGRPDSDIAVKYKHFYRSDFELVQSTGCVPVGLYGALLFLRAKIPLDNQELEGLASLLQHMCRLAPRSSHTLISDRVVIKKGDPISASECESLHALVQAEFQSRDHHTRFMPVVDTPQPRKCAAPVCGYCRPLENVLAAPYAWSIFDHYWQGAGFAWSFDDPTTDSRNSFVMTWSYYRNVYVARCTTTRIDGDDTRRCVTLHQPFAIDALTNFISDGCAMFAITAERRPRAAIKLYRAPCAWPVLGTGYYEAASEQGIEIRPTRAQRPPRSLATGEGGGHAGADGDDASGDLGDAGADGGCEDLTFEDLGSMLEAYIDEDELALGDDVATIADPEEQHYDSDGHEVGDRSGSDDDGHCDFGDGAAMGPLGPKPIYDITDLGAVEQWRDILAQARDATRSRRELLRHADAKAASQADAELVNGNISLVTKADTTSFVHWRNGAIFGGRVLTIDHRGRIVALHYAKDKPAFFPAAEGWSYPIKDAGQVCSKGKPGERLDMPQWCLQKQRRLRLQHFSGPQDPASYEQCIICSAAVAVGLPEHSEMLRKGGGAAEVDQALAELGIDVQASTPRSTDRTIADKYGPNKSDKEYASLIDQDSCIDADYHLQHLDSSGRFRVHRNCFNDRGEIGSLIDRQKSVESVGVLDTKSAWLMQDEDANNSDRLSAIPSATLLGGLKRARLTDKGRKTRSVQLSIQEGMRHCKLYRRGIYQRPECLVFLRELGNKTNAAFNKKAQASSWTYSGLGQKARREKRWEIANATPNNYRDCQYFYNAATTTYHDEDAVHPYLPGVRHEFAGKSIWEELDYKIQNEVDFTRMPLGHIHTVFNLAATAMRIFKQKPTLIVDIVLLMLPKAKRYEGDSTAWGKCKLAPDGLPLLVGVNEASLKGLLDEIGTDSKLCDAQKLAAKKAAIKQRMHIATKRKAAEAHAVAGRDVGVDADVDATGTFADDMCATFAYLAKVDESGRQSAKIEAFWKITLYAAATDVARLKLGSKDVLTEDAKLTARPSDCDEDFVVAASADDDDGDIDATMSVAQLQQKIGELSKPAATLLGILQQSNPRAVPVAANILSGGVMNSAMMALLQHVVTIGGAFDTEDNACAFLVKVLTEAVSEKLPRPFDDVAELIQATVNSDNMPLLSGTPFEDIMKLNIDQNSILMTDNIIALTDLTNEAVRNATGGHVFVLNGIQRATGMSFPAFWQRVYQKCLEFNAHCKTHDGIGFQQSKDKLYEVLMSKSHAKFLCTIKEHGIQMPPGWKISGNIDAFPTQRQKAVADVVEQFAKQNPLSLDACAKLADPLGSVVAGMKGQHLPQAAERQGQDVQMVSTGDLPGGEIKWRKEISAQEKAESASPIGKQNIVKRYLMSTIQTLLMKRAAIDYDADNVDPSNLLITRDFEVDPENPKITLQRAAGAGTCKLTFFGRVVEEAAAQLLGKATAVQIVAETEGDESFDIDGKLYIDSGRSDCCVAFLIPPLPPSKSSVSECGEPSKVQEKQKNGKQPLVATHRIEYRTEELEDPFGCVHVFKMPYLADIPEEVAIKQSELGALYRERAPFDDHKPERTSAKSTSSFFTR